MKNLAKQIVNEYYPEADAAFLCGSSARGTHRPGSDIDLVLVWQERDPKRESFLINEKLVEAFLHDTYSLSVFYEKDRQRGRPALAHMIADSLDLKPSVFSYDIRAEAQKQLSIGPPKWTTQDIQTSRINITDLIDDLEDSEDTVENYTIAAPLMELLFKHHQRIRNQWDAKGTHMATILKSDKTGWGQRFINAFESLYEEGQHSALAALVDWELKSVGGRLYEWESEADIPPAT